MSSNQYQLGMKLRDYLKPYLRIFQKEKLDINAKQFMELSKGLLQCQKAILSQAARKILKRKGKKKGTYYYTGRVDEWVRQSSKLLKNIKWDKFLGVHLKRLRQRQNNWQMIIHDESDIAKPYAKEMESLSLVHDGSKGEIVNGYKFCGSVGVGKEDWSISPIDMRLINPLEENFKCYADVMKQQIEDMLLHGIGLDLIHVFDRGFDDQKWFSFLDDHLSAWLVRLKNNRNVIFRNERGINIKLVAETLLEESSKTYKGLKYVYHPVWIKLEYDADGKKLKTSLLKRYYLIVIDNPKYQNPMMLISNCKIDSLKGAIEMYMNYIKRWEIEDFYRMFKQTLDIEVMQLMSFDTLSSFLRLLMLLNDFSLQEYSKLKNPLEDNLWETLASSYASTSDTLKISPYVLTEAIADLLQIEHQYGFNGKSSKALTYIHNYKQLSFI